MLTETWEHAPEYAIGSKVNAACQNKSIVRGLRYHRHVYSLLNDYTAAHPELGLRFIEEPWLRKLDGPRQMCQPDGILFDQFTNGAIIVEAKLNWKDGRDEKLVKLYLDAAKSAFGLSETWPLLITRNVRGYRGNPLLGLRHLDKTFEWRPGLITPVMLLV